MLSRVRCQPRLVALAIGLAVAAVTAAPARAVPTASLPPDLQQLLTAATSLAPAQMTAHVQFQDAAHPQNDLTETFTTSNALHGGDLVLTIAGQAADSRFVDGREYDTIPGLKTLTRNRQWVYKPDRKLAQNADPAGVFDRELQTGLTKLLQKASSVTETGPTTVGGQPATAFSVLPAPSAKPVVIDIAASGQLLSMASTTPKGTLTATISTDAPVQLIPPPAAASIPLAHLPKKNRRKVTGEIQGIQITESFLLATAFNLV